MAKLTPQIVRLIRELDVYQTVIRQRSEIIAHMETGCELRWRPGTCLSLEAHRQTLRKYMQLADATCLKLRMCGWTKPPFAMPAVVINGGITTTLAILRNNDAHLWDYFINVCGTAG